MCSFNGGTLLQPTVRYTPQLTGSGGAGLRDGNRQRQLHHCRCGAAGFEAVGAAQQAGKALHLLLHQLGRAQPAGPQQDAHIGHLQLCKAGKSLV